MAACDSDTMRQKGEGNRERAREDQRASMGSSGFGLNRGPVEKAGCFTKEICRHGGGLGRASCMAHSYVAARAFAFQI